MKLIITSIDAIIDSHTGEYFPGIREALKQFEDLSEDNTVAVISIHANELAALPDDFTKVPLGNYSLRRSPELIRLIMKQTELEYNDIFILGAKQDDMILAANSKVILLTADYARINNPNDRIYTKSYGIGIMSPARLTNFLSHFIGLTEPWFYSLEINDTTKMYGLTDAMTRIQNDDSVRDICNKLKDFLKNSNPTYKNPFLIYALMSVYQIFKDVHEIKYWGYYPSSGIEVNDILFDFKEVLRKSFKSSMTKENLLIRTKPSPQRKSMSAEARVEDACDSQFDSIIINPWFKGNLKGENVCIIDDFTNHGSSCETARHLLEKAGVNKIIFITLGKFRHDYKMFDYTIEGDLFTEGEISYTRKKGYTTLRGKINYASSGELLTSLTELVS